jgi:hypothetical protein
MQICKHFTDPRQRGAFAIDTPGSPACYRRKPVCGGPLTGAPKTTWKAGEQVTMRFQQNLNHFAATNPGTLVIDFSPEVGSTTARLCQSQLASVKSRSLLSITACYCQSQLASVKSRSLVSITFASVNYLAFGATKHSLF